MEALRSRIVDNARHQEGEEPSEDASALLVEAETALDELESLIQRINRTNAATPLGEGTITDAIARRDVLRLRHGVLTAAADAAAGRNQGGYGRQPISWTERGKQVALREAGTSRGPAVLRPTSWHVAGSVGFDSPITTPPSTTHR